MLEQIQPRNLTTSSIRACDSRMAGDQKKATCSIRVMGSLQGQPCGGKKTTQESAPRSDVHSHFVGAAGRRGDFRMTSEFKVVTSNILWCEVALDFSDSEGSMKQKVGATRECENTCGKT